MFVVMVRTMFCDLRSVWDLELRDSRQFWMEEVHSGGTDTSYSAVSFETANVFFIRLPNHPSVRHD
jgi:hypothetical protein